jgi:small subunit ribosomal protein S21
VSTGPSSTNPPEAIQCKPVEVVVGDRGVERAIKHLKRKMAAEGILRELKRRRHYMKPSVKRRKKESEAARRRRKRDKIVLPGQQAAGRDGERNERGPGGRESSSGGTKA